MLDAILPVLTSISTAMIIASIINVALQRTRMKAETQRVLEDAVAMQDQIAAQKHMQVKKIEQRQRHLENDIDRLQTRADRMLMDLRGRTDPCMHEIDLLSSEVKSSQKIEIVQEPEHVTAYRTLLKAWDPVEGTPLHWSLTQSDIEIAEILRQDESRNL